MWLVVAGFRGLELNPCRDSHHRPVNSSSISMSTPLGCVSLSLAQASLALFQSSHQPRYLLRAGWQGNQPVKRCRVPSLTGTEYFVNSPSLSLVLSYLRPSPPLHLSYHHDCAVLREILCLAICTSTTVGFYYLTQATYRFHPTQLLDCYPASRFAVDQFSTQRHRTRANCCRKR